MDLNPVTERVLDEQTHTASADEPLESTTEDGRQSVRNGAYGVDEAATNEVRPAGNGPTLDEAQYIAPAKTYHETSFPSNNQQSVVVVVKETDEFQKNHHGRHKRLKHGAGVPRAFVHKVSSVARSAHEVAAARMTQARVKFQRRFLRITITISIWVLIVLLWYALDLLRVVRTTSTFDPSRPLQIDVAGCDVRFRSGQPEVAVKFSLLDQGPDGSYAIDFNSNGQNVQSIYARSGSCNLNPNAECFRTCEVTVQLPANPPSGGNIGEIKISELGQNSASRLVVRVESGVILNPLVVRGEVISVEASNPVVKSMDVRVGRGSINLNNVSIFEAGAAACHLQTQSGNVHFTASGNVNYTLGARQPNGRYALKAHGGTNPFSNVDTDPETACGLTNPAAQRKVIAYYDQNGDGLVTVVEFKSVIQESIPMCCSSLCPTAFMWPFQKAADCDNFATDIFSDVASLPLDPTGRSRYGQLTAQDFFTRLVNLNDTGFINLCRDQASLESDSTTTATMALNMVALEGEVIFEHTRSSVGDTEVLRGNPDQPVALRVLSASADDLREISTTFGDRNNVQDDLYLNIVVHDPLGGSEPLNFVYVTRSAFLSLSPPYLALCGGYLLLPTIKTLHVDITLGPEFYSNITYDSSAPAVSENGINSTQGALQLVRVYDQLRRGLTPLGQLSLKGDLVRIVAVGDRQGNVQRHRYLRLARGITVSTSGEVTISTGDGDEIETIVDAFEQRAASVVGLNTAIAFLVALAITVTVHIHGRTLIQARYRTQRATALADAPASDFVSCSAEGLNPTSSWFSVFDVPVEFINLLIPYRRFTMNSLKKFCAQQVKLDNSVPLHNSVPFSEFLEQYESFCYANDLQHERDETHIRHFLYTDLPLYRPDAIFCRRTGNSQPSESTTHQAVSAINSETHKPIDLHTVTIEMISVVVLQGLKLNDSINYVRTGDPDPARLEEQILAGETSIPLLGALGGLHNLHDGYRKAVQQLANAGRKITAFPRKRAAAERLGFMLDQAFQDPALAGAEDDPEVQTLRYFLQYFCSFQDFAVVKSAERFEVSLQDFLDALKDFATYCALHKLKATGTGVVLGRISDSFNLSDKEATHRAISVFTSEQSNALLSAAQVQQGLRRRRVVTGIRWKRMNEFNFFTSRFMKEIILDAIVYTLVLIIPCVLFIGGALYSQQVYSITNGRIHGTTVSTDTIAELDVRDERDYFFPAYLLIVGTLCTTGIFALRILSHYFSVSSSNQIYFIWVKFASGIFSFSLLGAMMYLCIIALWIVVGMVLDPNKNLVSGVALITIVFVVFRTVGLLLEFRRLLAERVRTKLDEKLAERLQAKFRDLREDTKEKLHRDALKAYTAEDETITIGDLFNLLDETSTNSSEFEDTQVGRTLDFTEFSNMFDFLNLKISEHDKQVMFGFADKSNRGELLPEEFAEAWEYLKQDINQRVADKIGLSDGDILFQFAFSLTVFLLTIPFLFTAIALYENQGTFETVVYTAFVGATGIFANARTENVKEKIVRGGFLDKVIDAAVAGVYGV